MRLVTDAFDRAYWGDASVTSIARDVGLVIPSSFALFAFRCSIMTAFVTISPFYRVGTHWFQHQWTACSSRVFAGTRGSAFLVSGRRGVTGSVAVRRARSTPRASRFSTQPRMTIKEGEAFPKGAFGIMKDGAPGEIPTDQVFRGQTIVICGVPGAFTGTCNARHLPGFVNLAEAFQAAGAKVACLATNDAFVMDAWMKMRNAEGKIMPLSDGDASLLKQMGLVFDTGKFGGVRGVRFSMIVKDGIVKKVNVEEGGKFTEKSTAETVLQQLKSMS